MRLQKKCGRGSKLPTRSRQSKNLGERERAAALSQKIEPDGVYVGHGC